MTDGLFPVLCIVIGRMQEQHEKMDFHRMTTESEGIPRPAENPFSVFGKDPMVVCKVCNRSVPSVWPHTVTDLRIDTEMRNHCRAGEKS